MRMKDAFHLLHLAICGRLGSWPQSVRELALPLPYCSTQKSGPSFFLGSTIELTLLSGMQVSQPSGCESRREDSLPYTAPTAIGRAGPAFRLGKTVELALVVWVWLS